MMQYTNKPIHPYGQQEAQDVMRQQSAINVQEPLPGTLRGLMARAESLRKMSEATALHVIDIRVALIGHGIAEENSGICKPAAVPNGHLEAISDIFDHIEARLRVADASLEEIWAKVS